jgi:hypothetical protein
VEPRSQLAKGVAVALRLIGPRVFTPNYCASARCAGGAPTLGSPGNHGYDRDVY